MRRVRILFLLLPMAAILTSVPAQETPPKPPPAGPTGPLSEEEFKALHDLKGEDAPAPKGTNVTLGDGSAAYLSVPASGAPPFPGLVVIHEWWGLNGHIKHWCDRLAATGYAALAVDLYGGKVATNRDEAMTAMRAVVQDQARKTLLAAHRFLAEDSRVQAKKRGSIGWCFGGKQSIELALSAPDLDAAVVYYGTPVTDPSALKAVKASVCGVFGNRDGSIPPSVVDAFAAGLKAAGVEHEIWRYDAEHAFANPSSARYDTKAAGEAWTKVKAFLDRKLKPAR